jgi:hypothetical protein
MPVDSNLLGNTNNTFQNTSNTKVLNKGCDAAQGSALQGSALQGSALQGGGGYSNTFKTLEQNSNDNMGRGYGSTENYSHCNKQGGGGAEKLGSASHATNRFNHSFSGGYGYGKEGAAVAHELKGSYAAMTQNNDMNSCSGGRKHKRKPKRKSKKKCKHKGKCKCKGICKCKGKCKCKTKRKLRKRKPRRKSRKRKPRRKPRRKSKRKPRRKSRGRKSRGRKSRGRKSRRRRSRKTMQKGGSSVSYSSIDSNLTGNDARILGTNAFLSSDKNCGDGYNHYTGGNEKTIY